MNKYLLTTALLCILLFSGISTSCSDLENDFSTNPNYRLSFSQDTLSFDTVFTTIGSATRTFMVYNTNKETLKINQVYLSQKEKSPFRINVNGKKGDLLTDLFIWNKDSLYVKVEVTVDPKDKDQPVLVQDSIIFDTNGNRQFILLQAYGQDVIIYRGETMIKENTLFSSNRPYLIYDTMTIASGITATIERGATFFMHNKAQLIVEGNIQAKGTLEQPITFRGDRMDLMLDAGDKVGYNLVPGQWGGIRFGSESYDNLFEQVIVRSATNALDFQSSTPDRLKIAITNSQITNAEKNLLKATNCRIEASNTEFSNARMAVTHLTGGQYTFAHCTFVNYMGRMKSKTRLPETNPTPALVLSDTTKNETYSIQALFDNCIIDGRGLNVGKDSYKGEIALRGAPTGSETFDFQFNHCAIRSKANTNPKFINTLFLGEEKEDEPTMKYIKDGTDEEALFVFDFRLANKSLGIGTADSAVASRFPHDRYGVPRDPSKADIGAYVYVPQEEEDDKSK